MKKIIEVHIQFMWIPKEFGGHSTRPYKSMRTSVMWQKHPERSTATLHDVQWNSINLIDESQGTATICFSDSSNIEPSWIEHDELLEFRNGFRLLAIGRIQN